MTTNLDDMARSDMIVDLGISLLKTTNECCVTHGKDPDMSSMICAGWLLGINELDKAVPGFAKTLQTILTEDLEKKTND